MVTKSVDEAGISVVYPSEWSDLAVHDWLSTKEIKRMLSAVRPAEAELMGVDPNDSPRTVARRFRRLGLRSTFQAVSGETGDTLAVQVWRDQPWWADFEEYRQHAQASASSSKGGKLLSVTQTRIGEREAVSHFEQYRFQGEVLVFGHLEIKGDGGEVTTVGVTVNEKDRDLAESMIASVQAN